MGTLKIIFASILLIIMVSSCASKSNRHMSTERPDKSYVPEPGKALLIFERENSSIAWPYNSNVWDVTDKTDPKIVGYFGRGMRAAYYVEPGDYIFILTFVGNTDMLKATVEANKTYFVFMEMTFGSGLFFDAITAGEDNPIEMENISMPFPKLIEWSKQPTNKNSALTNLGKATILWGEMEPEDRERRILVPSDGR